MGPCGRGSEGQRALCPSTLQGGAVACVEVGTPLGPGPARFGWDSGRHQKSLVSGPVGLGYRAGACRLFLKWGSSGNPSKEALTSQAPRRRLAESGRVPGSLTRPVQGAQQPLATLVQGPREFLTLQQERRGCHVRQRHLAGFAGSRGKGLS